MIPPEIRIKKKSLSEILPKNGSSRSVRNVYTTGPAATSFSSPPNSRQVAPRRWWLLVVSSLVLVLIIWLVSQVLARAVVEIKPRQLTLAVAANITAVKIPPDSGSALQFIVMTLPTQEESQTVTATQSEQRSERASGSIIVYNTTTVAQKLIANTRFESPTGKIYRIDKEIIVPAQRTLNGQAVPGSVEAVVVADAPGEAYNSGPTDFTIPGFKSDPRFSKFYARSKTPLSGGFVGEKKVVAPEQLKTITTALQTSLKNKLLAGAQAQLPPELILFDQAVVINFPASQLQTAADQSAVTVVQSAGLEGVVFNRQALAKKLVEQVIPPEFASLPYEVVNLDRLQFRLASKVSPATADEVSFRIEGEAEILFTINTEDVAQKLQGVEKSAVASNLKVFPAIESAAVRFKPPWISRVPNSVDRIEIVIKS